MTAKCKNFVKSCNYCTTGCYKRPARRKARRDAKRALRASSSE